MSSDPTSSPQSASTDRAKKGTYRGKVVGQSALKPDIWNKVRGKAKYDPDLDFDDLLHAKVLRSQQPHAKLLNVETESAESIDGVECVLARDELMGPYDDRLRFYGDIIATVAAVDEETAARGCQAIEYELEPLPAVHDPHEAYTAEAPGLWEGEAAQEFWDRLGGNHPIKVENEEYVNLNNIHDYHKLDVGDVETGFRRADYIVEEDFVTPRVNTCNLMTHCTIAEWDGEHVLFTQTNNDASVFPEHMGHFLGIDPKNVDIQEPPDPGSSHGSMGFPLPTHEAPTASLARETGRPVRMWFDREEEFITTSRHGTHYTIKIGISEDGDITAASVDMVADTGAFPTDPGHVAVKNSRDRPLDMYDMDNFSFEGVSVYTNKTSVESYRAIGSAQLWFAFDSVIDELAHVADFDPVELRRRNFVDEGYVRPHTKRPIESVGVQECVDRGWKRFTEIREGPTDDPTKLRGWGVGAGSHKSGWVKFTPIGEDDSDQPQMATSDARTTDFSDAQITLFEDGSLHMDVGIVDVGQGSRTVFAQILSEETGIPITDIGSYDIERFRVNNEGGLRDTLGSGASRGTYIGGLAVKDGAEKLAAELRTRAAEHLGCPTEEIELDQGKAFGAAEEVPLEDLVDEMIIVVGHGESEVTPPAYGIDFAEVEIDLVTGGVEVLNFVAAQDVGYAINPAGVEGQLEGAVTHMLEFVLYSDLEFENGIPQNPNMPDYSTIRTQQMPRKLECEIIESNEETGPYGAKGVGTPSMPAIAPAISNAIRNATGTRFTKAPIKSEAVFNAVNDDEEKSEQ